MHMIFLILPSIVILFGKSHGFDNNLEKDMYQSNNQYYLNNFLKTALNNKSRHNKNRELENSNNFINKSQLVTNRPREKSDGEKMVHVKEQPESMDFSKLKENGDRVEFQIQGHKGPKTYIFGFDTGHGTNRQFRIEEKSKDGTVKGQYGYYDAKGKLRRIHYIARPHEGYEEKHHEIVSGTKTIKK